MNMYLGNPSGIYQSLDMMEAQATARWRQWASTGLGQPDGKTSCAPTQSRLQKILLPVGTMLIVMLLVVAGRI
jgi:hypothetical protein